MKKIPLTKGHVAIVDDDLYPAFLLLGGWYYTNGYAARVGYRNGKAHHVFMHQLVAALSGFPTDKEPDHKSRNRLDNRRQNLRPATKQQQQMNKTSRLHTSIYKGVHWAKDRQRWTASIRIDGRKKTIGHYSDEKQAARAYDKMARSHFGEFANPNFKYAS
jgi:hypothetical protein